MPSFYYRRFAAAAPIDAPRSSASPRDTVPRAMDATPVLPMSAACFRFTDAREGSERHERPYVRDCCS